MALSIISWFYYRNTIRNLHAEKAAYISNTLASAIDPARFVESVNLMNAGVKDSYVIEVQYILDNAINRFAIDSVKHIFIITPHSEVSFQYFAHGMRAGADPAAFGAFGTVVHSQDRGIHGQYAMNAMRLGRGYYTYYDTTAENIINVGYLIPGFSPIRDIHNNVVGLVGVNIELRHALNSALWFALFLAVVGIVIVVAMWLVTRWSISRTLTYSLKRLVEADHTFDKRSKVFKARDSDEKPLDDIGILYAHFSEIFQSFYMLIKDISEISQAHIDGYYTKRLDETKYSGGHLDLVRSINTMITVYADDILEVQHVMQEYGKGNFRPRIKSWSGEWEWVNETWERLRSNFVHITSEISRLSERASKGKFDIHADIGNLEGEWAEIINGLNIWVESVSLPLSEIKRGVKKMAKGDFSLLEINCEGEFAVVLDACNTTKTITNDIVEDIANMMNSIANGDLNVRSKAEYIGDYSPIKDSFGLILGELNKNINAIRTAASSVLDGSNQLTENALLISSGSNAQTATINELYSTISLIEQKTQESANRANEADTLAQQSNDHVKFGNEQMKFMIQSMQEINDSSRDISSIIKVIEDIASQTNLLALNAAVEASRAGEHGRGFSVVAEEVRSLASRSSEAAQETAGMVEYSVTRVNQGAGTLQTTADALDTILDGVLQVSNVISEISKISAEQAVALHEVSEYVSRIYDIVQSNAATSEECLTVASEFNAQSATLMEMVRYYKTK